MKYSQFRNVRTPVRRVTYRKGGCLFLALFIIVAIVPLFVK